MLLLPRLLLLPLLLLLLVVVVLALVLAPSTHIPRTAGDIATPTQCLPVITPPVAPVAVLHLRHAERPPPPLAPHA